MAWAEVDYNGLLLNRSQSHIWDLDDVECVWNAAVIFKPSTYRANAQVKPFKLARFLLFHSC